MKEIYESDEVPIDVFELKEAIDVASKYGKYGAEYVVASGPHYQIKVLCYTSSEKDDLDLYMDAFLDLDDIDPDEFDRYGSVVKELKRKAQFFDIDQGLVETRWEIADSEKLDKKGKKMKEFEAALKNLCKEMEAILKEPSSKKRRRKRSDDE